MLMFVYNLIVHFSTANISHLLTKGFTKRNKVFAKSNMVSKCYTKSSLLLHSKKDANNIFSHNTC